MSLYSAEYGRTADGLLAARIGDLALMAVPCSDGQGFWIVTAAPGLRSIGQWCRGDAFGFGERVADEAGFRAHAQDCLEHLRQRDPLARVQVSLCASTPWGPSQSATRYAEGRLAGCSLQAFEAATGLVLTDETGLKDELPPITTFLNRMLALTIDLQNILFETFEDLLAARIEGSMASGTFETGLETLRAESFIINGRRTIYTHPGTGAETQLLTIERRDRIVPLSLADAFGLVATRGGELLVNARSGRAAVRLRARSLIDDDGSVHRRVALQRPLEKTCLLEEEFAQSHWAAVDADRFAAAWESELGDIPAFENSTLHMVAGLLLPIWKRLPQESARVYRLQTDTGARIIGRRVSAAWAASVAGNGAVRIDATEAWRLLNEGAAVIEIAEGQSLRRVRAMNEWRIELSGFNDLGVARLKAMGLISEIVSWKLKLYVPAGAAGAEAFAQLIARFPVVRLHERKAARRSPA